MKEKQPEKPLTHDTLQTKGIDVAGFKAQLPFLIQGAHHSTHQTPNELSVDLLHYKLKLSGVYKSGATSLLAT